MQLFPTVFDFHSTDNFNTYYVYTVRTYIIQINSIKIFIKFKCSFTFQIDIWMLTFRGQHSSCRLLVRVSEKITKKSLKNYKKLSVCFFNVKKSRNISCKVRKFFCLSFGINISNDF